MKLLNFKKSFLTLLILTAFIVISSNTYAQPYSRKHTSKTPEQVATSKTDKLNRKLVLSSEQYKSIYSLILSAEQRIQSLRSGSTDGASIKDQIREINSSTNISIEKVLTAEQRDKFNGWKGNRDGDKDHEKKPKKHKKHKKNHEDNDDKDKKWFKQKYY